MNNYIYTGMEGDAYDFTSSRETLKVEFNVFGGIGNCLIKGTIDNNNIVYIVDDPFEDILIYQNENTCTIKIWTTNHIAAPATVKTVTLNNIPWGFEYELSLYKFRQNSIDEQQTPHQLRFH